MAEQEAITDVMRLNPQLIRIIKSSLQFSMQVVLQKIWDFLLNRELRSYRDHSSRVLMQTLSSLLPRDEGKLLKDLKDNLMVKRELGMIAGGLSLRYRKYMAIASAVFLTAKDVDFEKESALEDNSHVKRLIRFLSWLDKNLLNTCVDCCVGTWVSTCVSNCVRTWKSCSKNMKWIVNNSGVKKYQ